MPAEGVKLSGPHSRGKTVNGSFSGDTCNAGAEGATTHMRLESLRQKDSMEKISSSDAVIGLDTGMTHLSAAMGRPTVGIFRDYPIELVPLVGEGKKKALGGVGCCPQVQEVLSAFEKVIQ